MALTAVLIIPSLADAQNDTARQTPWNLRLETFYRWIEGTTEVDEFDVEGTRLDFSDDLGINPATGVRVGLRRDWEDVRLDAEVSFFRFIGSGQVGQDFRSKHPEFNYDEGAFSADMPFDIHGHFLLTRSLLSMETRSLGIGAPRGLRLIAGVEYPHFSLGVTAEDGDESTEDYKQYLPYPVIGVSYEHRFNETFAWETRLLGTMFADLPTYAYEGGMLKMSVTEADLETRLIMSLWGRFDVSLSAGYWMFETRLKSRNEDDNKFILRSPALMLGVEYRF